MAPDNPHINHPDHPENNRDDELNELWQRSKKAQPEVSVSEEEKQQALSNVLSAIEENENESSTRTVSRKSSPKRNLITYLSVAAAILLGIGITYLTGLQTYATEAGQMQTITLSDGSKVHLNAGSELEVPRYFGWFSRSVNLDGEAYFEVATNGQHFAVQTPNATVEVLGTAFNVRSRAIRQQYKTTVSVVEGKVLLQLSDRSREITLSKDESASVSEHSVQPAHLDAQQAASWKSGDMSFHNQSLPSIFSEIERRFDVRIEFPAEQLYSLRLSAFYSNPQKAESIIQDVCLAKGLKYRPTNNGFEIYKEK